MNFSLNRLKLFIHCRDSLKKLFSNVKKSPNYFWTEVLDDGNRDKLLNLGNYLLTSLPLSFLFYFLVFWIFNKSLNPIILYFCTVIFLIFFEYYYRWMKLDWIGNDEEK